MAFTVILLSTIAIIPTLSFADNSVISPRKQMASGIAAEDVVCKSGFALMKRTLGSVACLTPTSAEKLLNAGFGIIIKEATITETKQVNDFKCRNFTPGLQDPIKPKQVTDSDFDNTYDVIVIGAGISGLEAAHELDSEGIDVMILETRDRIGGRVNTITYEGTSLDLGGSWIHGYNNGTHHPRTENPIYKIASANHINVIKTDGSTQIRYPDHFEDSDSIDAIVESFKTYNAGILDHSPPDNYTLVDALTKYKKEMNQTIENKTYDFAISYEYEQDQGGDMKYIPGNVTARTQYFNNLTDEVIFPEGYNQIVNCLAGGLNIKHATVKNIDYTRSPVKVSTDQGIFEANHVVSTIPLGVLQKNMTELFYPHFDQSKKNSINNLKMGTYDKTYIIFDNSVSPFWDDEHEWFIRGVTQNDAADYDSSWTFFFNLHKFTKKPILLAFNIGSKAEKLENETKDTIKQQIRSALEEMYPGKVPSFEIIPPTPTRWANEPLSFGSFSFIPLTGSTSDMDELAKPIDDKLFFAGEATSKRYYGTVHGAYISGYTAAQEILNLTRNMDFRDQLDHGIYKDDICKKEKNQMLDNIFSEEPKCISRHS